MNKEVVYKFDHAKTIDSIEYIVNEIMDDDSIEKLCVSVVDIIHQQKVKPSESSETH